MKTRFIPALIMLLAGAIDCIISIYNNYTIDKFLIQLFVVLVIFFFIGCVVKIVLESSFKVMEEENPEESDKENDEQTEESKESTEQTKTEKKEQE